MSQSHVPSQNPVQSAPARAYLALAAGLLVIGISGILIRAADAPGPVSGFYRMGIGWLVLSVILAWRIGVPKISRAALGWTALAGLCFGLDMIFWTSGIMLSGPSKPTLMANTTPLWVGLGAMLLYQERHPPLFWGSLLLALTGVTLVVGSDLMQSAGLGLGSAFGLVSAFFYSGFFLAAQRSRTQIDALTFVWASSLVSAAVLLLAALLLGQDLSGYSRQTVLIFVLMGVVIQVLGWLLISFAQGYLPASIISPSMLGQSVLTALFSMLIFGEKFTFRELLGGLMVIGGVYLVHFSKQERKE